MFHSWGCNERSVCLYLRAISSSVTSVCMRLISSSSFSSFSFGFIRAISFCDKTMKTVSGTTFQQTPVTWFIFEAQHLNLEWFFYFDFELQEKVHICGTRRRKRLNTTWTRHFYTLQALKLDDDTTDVSRNICLTSKTKISFLVLIIWRKTPKYCEAEDVTDEQTNQNKPRLLD